MGIPTVVQWNQLCLWSTGTLVWSLAQYSGLKDLALLQRRSQLGLGSDPRPRNSIWGWAAKKNKKKKSVKFFLLYVLVSTALTTEITVISMITIFEKGWDSTEKSPLFFLLLFGAAPVAYRSSWARGSLIGATAPGLHHSDSNARSEPHLWPIPQLTAMPDP